MKPYGVKIYGEVHNKHFSHGMGCSICAAYANRANAKNPRARAATKKAARRAAKAAAQDSGE